MATEDHVGGMGSISIRLSVRNTQQSGRTTPSAPQGPFSASQMGWEGHLLSAQGPALGTPGFAPESNYLAASWHFVGWSFKIRQEPMFKGFTKYQFQLTHIEMKLSMSV